MTTAVASTASPPLRTDGLKTVEWSASDIQLFVAGLSQLAAGIGLLAFPLRALSFAFIPAVLAEIELRTKLPPLVLTEKDVPLVTLVGALLIYAGYSSVMTVYTVDEKAKRNSVSARFFFGLACVWVCTKTAYGTSAHILLAFFVAFPAFFLGLEVGFGDGNAVDIEEAVLARKKAARELEAKTK